MNNCNLCNNKYSMEEISKLTNKEQKLLNLYYKHIKDISIYIFNKRIKGV